MKIRHFFRRSLLLLFLFIFTVNLVTAAAPPAYIMKTDGGTVCVQDAASGEWVFRSAVCSKMLSAHDQKLLESGIFLYNQSDFTSAVEDFCS